MTKALPLVAYTDLASQVEALERDGYVYFWSLVDYLDDSSENILSQISRRHVNCEEGKLRNESVYSYDDNMGEGEVTIPDEVTISEWMTPPPGSNYDAYIHFGCVISKLSDEEMEELYPLFL